MKSQSSRIKPASTPIKRKTIAIIDRLSKKWPDPRCELYYRTEFQLLVSVVLSAQTTDKMVNECMKPIYDQGFTPETVIGWGHEALLEKIRRIGLAPTKAKNVYRLSEIIIDKHQGRVPNNREALEALPGVGRKTANVVLGEIFGEPTLAVDTHVYRVTQRLGLQNESNPLAAELKLLKVIEPRFLPRAHHLFIMLGRYVCKARKPECGNCNLNDICPSSLIKANA
ncbi:MAG: endonuclease III [Oligoflexales bacterium]